MKLQRIETERLWLRELRMEDAEHIYKTWSSDPRVTEFTNDTTDTSVEETREWLAVLIKQNEDDDSAEEAYQLLKSKLGDDMEVVLVNGGQPIYYYIVSVE